jgi:hypothetical protein
LACRSSTSMSRSLRLTTGASSKTSGILSFRGCYELD